MARSGPFSGTIRPAHKTGPPPGPGRHLARSTPLLITRLFGIACRQARAACLLTAAANTVTSCPWCFSPLARAQVCASRPPANGSLIGKRDEAMRAIRIGSSQYSLVQPPVLRRDLKALAQPVPGTSLPARPALIGIEHGFPEGPDIEAGLVVPIGQAWPLLAETSASRREYRGPEVMAGFQPP